VHSHDKSTRSPSLGTVTVASNRSTSELAKAIAAVSSRAAP